MNVRDLEREGRAQKWFDSLQRRHLILHMLTYMLRV